MNYEQQKRKGRFAMWSSAGEFIFGLILLSVAEQGKDTWEYYYSSSQRSNVELCTLLGWLGIIAGIAELIYGFILLSTADDSQGGNTTTGTPPQGMEETFVGEVVKKECNFEHQVEWITFRQKNGNQLRCYHKLSDNTVYQAGERGKVRTKDREIVEFICENNLTQVQ